MIPLYTKVIALLTKVHFSLHSSIKTDGPPLHVYSFYMFSIVISPEAELVPDGCEIKQSAQGMLVSAPIHPNLLLSYPIFLNGH